jgi:hypothetical protein
MEIYRHLEDRLAKIFYCLKKIKNCSEEKNSYYPLLSYSMKVFSLFLHPETWLKVQMDYFVGPLTIDVSDDQMPALGIQSLQEW